MLPTAARFRHAMFTPLLSPPAVTPAIIAMPTQLSLAFSYAIIAASFSPLFTAIVQSVYAEYSHPPWLCH